MSRSNFAALAWKVAIGWLIFGWVSMFATVARFGFYGMYRSMGYSDAELVQILPFTKAALGFGAVLAAAFLVFLIVKRKHFLLDTAQPPMVLG